MIQDSINFSETCLKDLSDYKSATRKYWIYLPPNYEHNKTASYPLMLFLDGSSYLDYVPVHIYLDRMISEGVVPPCVGVFLDSAEGHLRDIEYNCHERFTQFICQEFLDGVRHKHQINVTSNPMLSTIIGTSYSGFAAFYTALTKPEFFGHCIAQSPHLIAQPLSQLDKIIHDYSSLLDNSSFSFEMGTYENIIGNFEYADGTVQSSSSLDVVRHVYEEMRKKTSATVSLHEFVGGHNYVCLRVSLYDRIKEVYSHCLGQAGQAMRGCSF